MLQDTRITLFLLAELVVALLANDPDTFKQWLNGGIEDWESLLRLSNCWTGLTRSSPAWSRTGSWRGTWKWAFKPICEIQNPLKQLSTKYKGCGILIERNSYRADV